MNGLNLLNSWNNVSNYFARRSAQSYFSTNQMAFAATGCGSSCGSDDKGTVPPAACGAADDAQPKPSACGSSCGAGDK